MISRGYMNQCTDSEKLDKITKDKRDTAKVVRQKIKDQDLLGTKMD